MAIKIQTKKPTATVTSEIKDTGKVVSEDSKTETVDVGTATSFDKPWCEVGVDASYTHNLGNYQSARVGVHLMIPCKHEELDEVYAIAESWVNDKLSKMMSELQGS